MNGAPTALHTAAGKNKPGVTGKKGNIGGISTPGRKGRMIKALTALVKPGAGTTKTVKTANFMRPEAEKKPSVGPHTAAKLGSAGPAGGAASKAVQTGARITTAGHKGTHIGVRPEPAIKRDSASVVKPHSA